VLHSRERRYAFVFLLLALNALMSLVGAAVVEHGWLAAGLNLFNVSAIVWLALAASLSLTWQAEPGSSPHFLDSTVFAATAIAALVPVPTLSAALLTLIAAWAIWTSAPASALRRASIIMLSLTAFLLWGRIALAWGAGPLLAADARFVGLLADTRSAGNAVYFADGTNFVIAPGCSSLHGISLALILWTTVVQYFAVRLTPRVWLTLALALVGSVLVNGLRLAVIAWNPHDFNYWHTGGGGVLFGWIALGVIVAVVYGGLGRARRLA
jgi:exosortase/archaeosortase family protein